jgi:thiamine biosynthesis lipoprotein
LVQVSVVARDLVQADVWATAAYARGAESIRQIDSHNLQHPEASIQMLAVFPDGNLAATAGFEALLARD